MSAKLISHGFLPFDFIRLFLTFKDLAREKDIELKVETIRTDFEEAAIKAATKVFDVGKSLVFPYHYMCKQNLDEKEILTKKF